MAPTDISSVVVIEANEGSLHELSRRIRLQGAEPVVALGIADAAPLLPTNELGTVPLLIDVALASRRLKKELAALRREANGPELFCVAAGEPANWATRKRLRAAGVGLALWNPFDDATLRFQLNRAWNGDRDDHKRESPRIPTYLHAQIGGGQRVKDGVVYTLSVQGAFIETPRASMSGARVELAIRLPNGFVKTPARVVFSNVPGNLQRPNLPLGMAVRFDPLEGLATKQLKTYIKNRLAQLEV